MSSPPRATYRLQLRGGMDFAAAAELVPYLARLQISHLYLSPPFAAANGSTHGYDVIDPNRFDPTLGGEAGFMALSRALKEAGLGLLLDIVPNHMGVGRDNAWWWDVLKHGRQSRRAAFFDIDFAADPDGKLVLPILGATLEEVIARGELRVVRDDPGGEPLLGYFDERFPLAGDPDAGLAQLLDAQHYRLIFWREGAQRRNYRRFFNIDELAGLRVEDPEVFEASHELILDLARRDLVQGLRIDHVDGLTDPKAYLERLQQRLREVRPDAAPFYVVVEKILIGDEQLPSDWPVAGTTGYEFMNEVSGVFVDRPGLHRLGELASEATGERTPYRELVQASKSEVLDKLFAGELEALSRRAAKLCNLGADSARAALRRLLAAFPVYRTYVGGAWRAEDAGVLEQAFATAGTAAPADVADALRAIERVLGAPLNEEGTAFLRGLQQLSGPLMAKSVEDTAFYRYPRLLALNEVGGEPDSEGLTPQAFHRLAARRLERWPDSMLATATHDTKRGEDARARLAVLTEVPEEWAAAVAGWRKLNARLPAIHPKDEYTLYQSLLGAWPVELRPDNPAGLEELLRRLEGWLIKALREGKERSDWNAPDEAYEARALEFLRGLLAPGSDEFLDAVGAFVRRLAPAAAANSLTQLLLKLTAPGVPDIYQGTEFWDLSLVDPDNRRAVDFAARDRLLGGWPPDESEPKASLLRRGLALRARLPELFARGRYHPLAAEGPLASRVLAFGRVLGERLAITVVPHLLGPELIAAAKPTLGAEAWNGTALIVPRGWADLLVRDQVLDQEADLREGRLALAPLLSRWPVALLATG